MGLVSPVFSILEACLTEGLWKLGDSCRRLLSVLSGVALGEPLPELPEPSFFFCRAFCLLSLFLAAWAALAAALGLLLWVDWLLGLPVVLPVPPGVEGG